MNIVEPSIEEIINDTPGKKMEYCGRVCYKSDSNINDTSYIKFLQNIAKSGHCYDSETEVLTDSGFKKWSEVTEQDLVGAVDPLTRNFKGFEKPLKFVKYDVDEEMVSFENKDISLLITNGHKIYASFCNTEYKRTHPNFFELIETNKEIVSKRNHPTKFAWEKPLRMSSSAKNNSIGLPIKNEMFKLFGFFIGDGCATKLNGKISFHLKKDRKIEWLKNTLNECSIEFSITNNNDETVLFTLLNEDREKWESAFYNKDMKKTFPLDFLAMSKEQFSNFYDGLVNSDGSIYNGQVVYSTNSVELIDRLQALLSINDMVIGKIYKCSECYKFNIFDNNFPMFNDSRKEKDTKLQKYSGTVYCCQVSTGLLVIRRNNKVALCGNCSVLEHERLCFEIDMSYDLNRIIPNLKYFTITSNGFKNYISADVRAWLENCNEENIFYPHLQEVYPFLFNGNPAFKMPFIKLVDKEAINNMDKELANDIKTNHVARTFKIICSRSCTHQLVRHRAFSFSQQSQRYCNFSNDKFGHSVDFIMPEFTDVKKFSNVEQESIKKMLLKCYTEAEDNYFNLIDAGLRAEDARSVLPNAAASIIVMTGTVKAWEGFFKLRCDAHAQREIRDIACLIKSEIYK